MKQVWCRAGSRFPLMDKLHAVEKHKWRRLWGHACVLCCRKWITLSRRKYTRNLLSLPFERAFKMPAGSRGWFKQTGMTESKVSSLLYNEVVQSFYKRKGSLELNHLKLTNSKTVCEVLSRESNWLIDLLSTWLWFNRREGSSEDFLKIMAAIHKGKGPILTHGLARGYPNFTLTWMDNKCWVPGSWLCLPRWRVRAAGAVGLPASLQGARQQGLVGSARSGCATTARRPARGAAGWGFNRLGVKSEWRETVERQIMCITNLNILLIDFFFFFCPQRWPPQTWPWRSWRRTGTRLWPWQWRPAWWQTSRCCCCTEPRRTAPTAGTSLLCWSVDTHAHAHSHLFLIKSISQKMVSNNFIFTFDHDFFIITVV